MLGGAELVAFLATADAARARQFYEGVLGLRVVDEGPYALVLDSGGVTIRVQKIERVTPPSGTALGWSVPDVATAARGLSERGVALRRHAGLEQDELGIWTSPAGARVAWFDDPDGNVLSLTEARGS